MANGETSTAKNGSNGKSSSSLDDWKQHDSGRWQTAAVLSRSTGLSTRHLAKLGDQGAVPRQKNGEGVWLYDRDAAEDFAPKGAEELSDYIASLVSLLKQAEGHTAETFRMVHGPAMELFGFYKAELAAARVRIEHLERTHDDLVKAKEDALSQVHERQIAERLLIARQARWDKAFDTLSECAPGLLNQLLESIFAASSGASATLLAKILASVEKRDIEGMLANSTVSEDERTILRQVLSDRAGEKDGEGNGS